MNLRQISLDVIDLKDERFRFSYHFDLDRLLLSVKEIGLVNPPVVINRESRFILVTGWKRFFTCLELSLTPLPVFILEQDDDFKAFLFSLYENLTHRDFDLLEKAEILRLLKGFIKDEKQLVKDYLPLLGIPATLPYLDLYVKISQLESRWKKVIYEKKMSLASVELLTEFDVLERELLLPLILPLSQNKQKQILDDLIQISRKEEISLKKILATQEIQPVLKSEKLTPLQKAEKIHILLRKERYPSLSAWKESFDASLKRACLSKEVTVESSSFFENGEFSVSFSLRDKEEFSKRLAKLEKLISDEALISLFKRLPDG
ncbi:MAG: ParB/RepB/Spo0J family partition protein [Candidatus Aminicenantes bacterium]|nr:ParB/RepB/Spo0J family partition protein [Candidatus Aminicenantes bacterium]